MKPKKPGSKYRLTSLKLDELSGVDRPAQEGARVVIAKREEPEVERQIAKVGILTSSEEGHQHLLDDTNQSGSTSYEYMGAAAGGTDYRNGHSHPWVKDAAGNITIGDALGHGHQLASAATETVEARAPKQENVMDPTAQLAALTAQIETLKTDLAKAQRLATLSDDQRAHLAGLAPEDATTFLAKSATERAAVIEAAKAADPVVYTTADGVEIRKSEGARTLAMARKLDELAAVNKAQAEAAVTATLTKRAETELQHLPGTVTIKVAALRALESITDEETRKGVAAMLAAQNGSMGKAFVNVGTQRSPQDAAGGNPEATILAIAKRIATEKKLGAVQAYDEALLTPEGSAAYAELRRSAQV